MLRVDYGKICCPQRPRRVRLPAMNFPKFWAKGTHQQFTCWRWSDSSLAEAAALAQEAARRLAERFAAGENLRHGYGYPDRPLREPVLREIKAPGGEVAAVITRNSYGAQVVAYPMIVKNPERPSASNPNSRAVFVSVASRPAGGVQLSGSSDDPVRHPLPGQPTSRCGRTETVSGHPDHFFTV